MLKELKGISIALHIPISPNNYFYSRIKWIRKSLDSLGEPYNSSKLHITVSNEENITKKRIIDSFKEFKKYKQRYKFYITDHKEFTKYSYGETAGLRYLNIDDSDITIFCDSDIIFINNIDDLLLRVLQNNGIYGVIAHYSPFIKHEKTMDDYWNDLSEIITNKKIILNNSHSLNPTDKCPAYFNNGFVIGDKATWDSLKNLGYENFKVVFNHLDGPISSNNLSVKFFTMQISLSLIININNTPAYCINEIYNCANQNEMLNLVNNNLDDIRIIHYLRNLHYDRDLIFYTKKNITEFLNLTNIDEVSKVMQKKITSIIKKQGYN